jgi:chemotaxis protein histidine kinase CheA
MGESSDDQGATFIKPPDTLTGKVRMGSGGVDMATLEKAEAMIANLQGDYLEWAAEDLANLGQALAHYTSHPEDVAAANAEVFRVAHDMKGQGGSFGYGLVTEVGDRLCRLLDSIKGHPTEAQAKALALHVEAMRIIFAQRMEGDGGSAGQALVAGLEQVVRKLSSRDAATGA